MVASPGPPTPRYANMSRSGRIRFPGLFSAYPIASASAPSRDRRWPEQMSSSRRSIAARSSAKGSSTSLEIHLPQHETAVGLLDQHLHLRLGLFELARRRAQQLDAFLEELERGIEPDLLAFERGHDLVQPAEIFLERHAGKIRLVSSPVVDFRP